MGNKKDIRSIQTESLIMKGFAKLLQEKELNKITVSELTRYVQINRATFYDHFSDIYDLYDKMIDAFFNELERALEDDSVVTCSDFFCVIIDLLINNKSVGKLVFLTSKVMEKIESYFTNGCLEIWKEELGLKNLTPEIQLLASYRVNGCIGTIKSWVYNDYSYPTNKFKKYISKIDESLDESIKSMI